jgi:hypothetical protein
MRGWLWRASRVCQASPTYTSSHAAKSIGEGLATTPMSPR